MKMKSSLLRNTERHKLDLLHLDSLNRELAIAGFNLQTKRIKLIKELQPVFQEYVAQISNGKDQWEIHYVSSMPIATNQEMYLEMLRETQDKDIQYKNCFRGIHKDTFHVVPPNHPTLDIKNIGSQGQKRTVALSLKMAQFRHTQHQTHETPILLIDDVLNELDTQRRECFIQFLNQIGQAFIATTEIKDLESFIQTIKKQTTIKTYQIKSPIK